MNNRVICRLLLRIVCGFSFASFFLIPTAYTDCIGIAVDESNAPFMYKDAAGDAQGLYPVIVDALFEKIEKDACVEAYPWNRLLLLSKAGDVGVAGIYKNPDRLLIYDYSEPIFEERIVVFMKYDNTFPFASIEDLKTKHIGVIRGWSYGETFDAAREQQEFSVDATVSDETNFKKLALGRLDCVLAIEESGRILLNKLNLQNEIVASDVPLLVNPTYIVFSKKENQIELINELNAAIAEMKEEGSYEQLIHSTFEEYSQE